MACERSFKPVSTSQSRIGWLAIRRTACGHIIAGLTTAAVVIPKAMAYATIAGLPVQVGLYTAFVPMVIYAVLGTSRDMV